MKTINSRGQSIKNAIVPNKLEAKDTYHQANISMDAVIGEYDVTEASFTVGATRLRALRQVVRIPQPIHQYRPVKWLVTATSIMTRDRCEIRNIFRCHLNVYCTNCSIRF